MTSLSGPRLRPGPCIEVEAGPGAAYLATWLATRRCGAFPCRIVRV
jgi:hypothetical protein